MGHYDIYYRKINKHANILFFSITVNYGKCKYSDVDRPYTSCIVIMLITPFKVEISYTEGKKNHTVCLENHH